MILAKQNKLLFVIGILFLFVQCQNNNANLQFISKLPKGIKRSWINENFWANKLQDWQVNNGRIECVNGELPLRTVHLLPYVISKDSGDLRIELELGTIMENDSLKTTDFAGLLLGAGSLDSDFRKRAVVYGAKGENSGIVAAVNGQGKIIFQDNETGGETMNFAAAEELELPKFSRKGLFITIDIRAEENSYSINLSIIDRKNDEILSYAKVTGIEKHKIEGNIALVANGGCDENKSSFWFKNLNVSGNKLKYNANNKIGPIVGVIFTNFENKLSLRAQFMPLAAKENKEVLLEMSEYQKNDWKVLAKTQIDTLSYTAKFNVNIENSDIINEFRISYKMIDNRGKAKLIEYKGIVPNNKNQQNIIKLALLKKTSFNNRVFNKGYFNFMSNQFILPSKELIQDFNKQKPDLFLFMGAQVNSTSFEDVDFSSFNKLKLNYLYKWYMWYWSFGELTKNYPSILIPNNTDFFVEDLDLNLQEELKKKFKKKNRVNDFLNLVNETQSSNDILSVDEKNIINTISFKFGNISFALLANKHSVDSISEEDKNSFVKMAALAKVEDTLSDKNIDFIEKWSLDWMNTEMKAIITHYPIIATRALSVNVNRYYTNLNALVPLAKKTYSVFISGAENQSSLLKHGTKAFADASYNYTAPSLKNSSKMEILNEDLYTDTNDKIQILAKEKKILKEEDERKNLSYGIVHFNKFQKTISFENRYIQVGAEDKELALNKWSKKILIGTNFSQKTPSYLPLLKIKGTTNFPVIFIYESKSQKLIYAKRIRKMSFKPKVYFWSRYDIVVLDPVTGKKRTFKKILAKNIMDTSELIVNF